MLCLYWLGLYVIILSGYEGVVATIPEMNYTNNCYSMNQIKHRNRRYLLNIMGDPTETKTQTGNNSPVYNAARGSDGAKSGNSWNEMLRHSAGRVVESAGRVVEGATDVVLAPVNWLAHMQNYWPFYVVCSIIVLSLVTYLYCSCQNQLGNIANKKNYDPAALMNLLRQQTNLAVPGLNL
ncbi:unnamed protein product [Adineta steineri]|uniref:Uncharacterized protein n=1 Tax=Adineta steineri TaxID=433720 RepID=A0A818M192_9BILA|nr:unnamed protein product [Adineta steineri]CAF1317377.1 unnamed protein product [Adineta steineri]CAF3554540.1 unnamed protein product [Adineta steineri]CAF3586887.1 unnamed protein product [Adineta steineri]